MRSVDRSEILRRLREHRQKDHEFRTRWLEENKPAPWPGERVKIGSRICPTNRQSIDDWHLHRLTWNHLEEQGPLFSPKPGTTWEDYAVPALLDIFASAWCQLERLTLTYREHDAIVGLASHALSSTRTLSLVAGNSYFTDALRTVARTQVRWPCLKSPHEHFCDDEVDLLDKLQVGKSDPRLIDKHAKWNPNDEAGRVAMFVWEKISAWRQTPALVAVWSKQDRNWREAAMALPEFDADKKKPAVAVEKWFSLAKRYLKQHPELLVELNTVVPKSKRRKDGGISSHVFTKLREKFLSMAGFNQV